MHPCLYVDEILGLIAHELVTSTGWATSVALACCCKSFEDPVLDALWETQSRVLPLLNSLPDDVWGEGRCHVSAPMACVSLSLNCLIQKSLKRLPTALEWARFRKCESSENGTIYPTFLRGYSRFSGFVLSAMSHCFRIWTFSI